MVERFSNAAWAALNKREQARFERLEKERKKQVAAAEKAEAKRCHKATRIVD